MSGGQSGFGLFWEGYLNGPFFAATPVSRRGLDLPICQHVIQLESGHQVLHKLCSFAVANGFVFIAFGCLKTLKHFEWEQCGNKFALSIALRRHTATVRLTSVASLGAG